MRILIISMVPQRDWLIDSMIADAVKEKGHEVFLRKFLSDDRTAVIFERPDVAVIPVIRCEYTRDLAIRLRQWGVRIVSRRSEAGVSRKQYEKLPRHWQLDHIGRYDYKDLIDLELIWSSEFADILVEEGKIRREQAKVIGAITLDPYFKWNLQKYSHKVFTKDKSEWLTEKKLDPNKKTLYFITGFVHAERTEYTLPEAPIGDPIHKELYDRDRRLRDLWFKAIERIVATGTYNIIVRPHHGENLSFWSSLNGNTRVSTEGSAGESLFYSDLMVHSGSTMAIEAHLFNKPALRFGNTAQDELIGRISPQCEDVPELIESIDSIDFDNTNANISEISDLEKSFFGPIDGKAHQRAADAICETEPTQTSIPLEWPEEELNDYSSEGIIKIDSRYRIIYCNACKKASQNETGGFAYRCPHCGITITNESKE